VGLLAPTAGARGVRLTSNERALVLAINGARVRHGLARLRIDLRLERAARSHSADMLKRGYFDHGNFAARMAHFHCRGRFLAENLAWGAGLLAARTVVGMWLSSPSHRENLLYPGLRRIGVATPVGTFQGYESTMVTADFAGS
jgi:uncharacterized protein YkwD